MGAFRVTGNLLMSFAMYWGLVALLYGGNDVGKAIRKSYDAPTQAAYGVSSPLYVDTAGAGTIDLSAV